MVLDGCKGELLCLVELGRFTRPMTLGGYYKLGCTLTRHRAGRHEPEENFCLNKIKLRGEGEGEKGCFRK